MSAVDWLLQGDPAIAWQTRRDLTDASPNRIARARAEVAHEGWGARVLSLQGEDGMWAGGVYTPKWTSTTYTLLLLRHFGIDPGDTAVRAAITGVRERVVWPVKAEWPFFGYRGETCITGMVLALAAYFGATDDGADDVVQWLFDEQLPDGGWNCRTVSGSRRSSFHTTISVLEGLLEMESRGGDRAIPEARSRAEEYLMERRMLRSLSTGEVINSRWSLLSFPPRWHYDVLRGLDYLRDAGVTPDARLEEAVAALESKRDEDGKWPLQNPHRGKEHFSMEAGAGEPSRWNTLRALRVLRWYHD